MDVVVHKVCKVHKVYKDNKDNKEYVLDIERMHTLYSF